MACDSRGAFYVSDGADSNVKVYSLAGNTARLLREIGQQGGHRPGAWTPQAMNNPTGIAVEERADGKQLWVTENSICPRRVSVWGEDGKLTRDYIGNTRYCGSGGLLSDDDPSIGIVDGVIYKVDYQQQTYTPLEVMGGVPDPVAGKASAFPLGTGGFGNGYYFISAASGKPVQYYVEAAECPCKVYLKRGEHWVCVAALGNAGYAKGLPVPAPNGNAIFSWSDLNGDGFQSADEMQWFYPGKSGVLNGGWGFRCDRNLVFYHSGFAFRPQRFTADGAPIYDVSKAEKLPGELANVTGDIYKTKFGYVADRPDPKYTDWGGTIHGLHNLIGFDDKGALRWTYPNYWLAVHGAFTAPMAMPGVIMGMLKV